MAQPRGHDMSKFWRLVSVEGGLVTGTWWVSSPDRRGESWVKSVDVVVWHDELHRSGVVMNAGITASVAGGVVDLPRHMIHGQHKYAVWSNLDAVKASILAAVEAVEWPCGDPDVARTAALIEADRREGQAVAWDEGYAAGWSDGGDANCAGLDHEDEHHNPYRKETLP